MDQVVNCDPKRLDLSRALRAELAPGIEVTMAPNRNTGDMETAIFHFADVANDDVAEYVTRRVETLIQESGMSDRRTPVRGASQGGSEEDFFFFFKDPSDKLNLNRMIQVNEFDEWARDRFIIDLMRLDTDAPTQPIVIMITSMGGYVHALFGMLGFAQIVQAPIYTVVVDMAYSCGALLAAAAAPKGNRFITQHGEIMVHEIFGGVRGQMPDVEAGAEDMKRVNTRLFQILGDVTSKTTDEWKDIVRNKENKRDHFYFPDEAIELGLVDAVLSKEDYPQLFARKKDETNS